MGNGMSIRFKQLISDRKLVKGKISKNMITKEIEAAKYDLEESQDSLKNGKLKWATIQGYYSMFHSARALLYSKGYREKSHYALSVAIEDLFSIRLGHTTVNAFRDAMSLRQEADYGLKFSKEGAIETIEGAEKFLAKVEEVLK